MEIKDLTIEYTTEFKSNRGNFDKQPIFTLVKDAGLTGDDFIALYRIRQSTQESASLTGTSSSADGRIGLTIGTSSGLTSLTGSTIIKAQSLVANDSNLTADWGAQDSVPGGTANLTLLSTTGTEYRNVYSIIFNQIGKSRFELITLNKTTNTYQKDISITGISNMNSLNLMGSGIRPMGRQRAGDTIPDGDNGKAEILTYIFNKMEQQEQWTSSGLTGVFDTSFNNLTGALYGKAAGHGDMQSGGTSGSPLGNIGPATVTGWTLGPVEGGFRFDNGGYIKTDTSDLFNTRLQSTSGMTFMTYVRFHSTGSNQNILTVAGDETDPAYEIKMMNGNMVFSNFFSSITAGSITSADNPMAGGRTFELNRWYHVAGKIEARIPQGATQKTSDSGMSMYINGERCLLARSLSSDSLTSVVSGGGQYTSQSTSADTIMMPNRTSPKFYLMSDKDNNGAQVPADISITRVFTRGLSNNEIFQNYIATIPSNSVVESINVG